uniref:Uncharacterized protein n=2 Tax=Setaria italica TaxID=4555 RepID=K3YC39_SETIT
MEIAKVDDLRGVEPGTPGWVRARAAVTASMAAHSCVLVAHDTLGMEPRRCALFGRALPDLFALLFEGKKCSGLFCNGSHRGYEVQVPAVALETLPIPDATEPSRVRDLAGCLWPQGNPYFW